MGGVLELACLSAKGSQSSSSFFFSSSLPFIFWFCLCAFFCCCCCFLGGLCLFTTTQIPELTLVQVCDAERRGGTSRLPGKRAAPATQSFGSLKSDKCPRCAVGTAGHHGNVKPLMQWLAFSRPRLSPSLHSSRSLFSDYFFNFCRDRELGWNGAVTRCR